jgi:3-deoxy-D-manno-octulosonic acid kinase
MQTSRGGEFEKERRLKMRLRVVRTDSPGGAESGAILYDPSRIDQPMAADFDPDALARAGRVRSATAGGRGSAWFVAGRGGGEWVLRHYRRGGLVARFVRDAYAWPGEQAVRSFRELRLLEELERLGLPAPAPVAARYLRRGLVYRADLITVAIPGVVPLSARLGPDLPREAWCAVGACIRRFHDAGVFHADLNAHNVLLDAAGRVWIVDFDRGELRPGTDARWRQANLARLERSLTKISAGRYRPEHWAALLDGYAGSDGRGA